MFGAPFKTGDADFWPNSGRNQPNCPPPNLDIRSSSSKTSQNLNQNFLNQTIIITDYCNHRRSWIYFVESLRSKSPEIFQAVSCKSWNHFVVNTCNKTSTPRAYMGIRANPMLKGNFYLQTNSKSPFNRNQDGTLYKE